MNLVGSITREPGADGIILVSIRRQASLEIFQEQGLMESSDARLERRVVGTRRMPLGVNYAGCKESSTGNDMEISNKPRKMHRSVNLMEERCLDPLPWGKLLGREGFLIEHFELAIV
ncbi:uncharacterized protein G2W53_007894 [Senna tora]|uniref:Uncharacterized protein n=1 Tax=Senna tora TaxID=362788 RepID=A0A834X7T3_9FABA|nr:uncharacterized protein G2W53_007894 [Senna tora]